MNEIPKLPFITLLMDGTLIAMVEIAAAMVEIRAAEIFPVIQWHLICSVVQNNLLLQKKM
ncbi:MAG: hypothetical protein EOO45_27350 [Flavobacterium sp.]|nr:MAG: hypothetical protein EOO45_27350 [Flavobacterium sp.]